MPGVACVLGCRLRGGDRGFEFLPLLGCLRKARVDSQKTIAKCCSGCSPTRQNNVCCEDDRFGKEDGGTEGEGEM